MARRRTSRRRLAWGAVIAPALVWAVACATAEQPAQSDSACVAGGCPPVTLSSSASSAATSTSTSGSGSSSGGCMVDAGCAVSFKTDILDGIMNGPAACTAMTCHGGGAGGLSLSATDSSATYMALTTYTLLPSPGPMEPYVVPCEPSASGFACNVKATTDGGNPFGTCGSPMPNVGPGLTTDQIAKIGQWIQCGAPEN